MNNTSWLNNTPMAEAAMTNYTHGRTTNYTHVILYSFLILCSLLGNILVIAVVFGNRNLRTNFNHLIVNMAVSDLFIPLLILPLKIIEEINGQEWLVDGPLGEALCKLCYFFIDISPAVSVFSLVIIAVNRYISIAYPMRSQVFSRKKSRILISTTWIMSAALFSPYLYTFNLHHDRGFTECYRSWSSENDQLATTVYYSLVTAIIFVVPLIAIIMMYSLMAYRIKLNSKNIEGMLNDKQARKRRERNNNIFYVSIVIVCCFVFLWGPYHCFAAVFLTGNIPQNTMATFVVQFLGYANSAVNPCVYFIFLKQFRKGLRNLGKRERNGRNNSMSLLSSKLYKDRRESKNKESEENQLN